MGTVKGRSVSAGQAQSGQDSPGQVSDHAFLVNLENVVVVGRDAVGHLLWIAGSKIASSERQVALSCLAIEDGGGKAWTLDLGVFVC